MGWTDWLMSRLVAVIATTGADGTPHAVPVEVVVRDGRVYSWCRSTAVRVRNLERDARAAIVAYKGGSAFVLVRGRTRFIAQGAEGYDDITEMFLRKYDRDETFGNDLVVELTPDEVVARDID